MRSRPCSVCRLSGRLRAWLVVLVAVVAVGAGVPGRGQVAGAQSAAAPVAPGVEAVPSKVLSSVTNGKAAVAALGLDQIAARNASIPRDAVERVLADPAGRVDPTGKLFFADDGLGDDPDHGVAPAERPAAEAGPAAAPSGSDVASSGPSSAAAADGVTVMGGTPAILPANAFNLASRPSSTKVIYLDFDGETVTGSAWNASSGNPSIVAAPFDRDGDPSSFDDNERLLIIETWAAMAEDYRPFDVNVTTIDPGLSAIDRTDLSDQSYGTRMVFTNSTLAASATGCTGGCAGIAYVGVFDTTGASHQYYQPAWGFMGLASRATRPSRTFAMVGSHEVGHNLGLSHDSCGTCGGYYAGQGSWTPIMGSGSNPVQQFSIGDYTGATNTEDDYAVIAGHGPALLADDYPDSTTNAPLVDLSAPVSGIITTRADVDYLRFSSGGGSVTVTVSPVSTSPDLDVNVELRDAANALVASANPACGTETYAPVKATGLGATVTASGLAAGTYYLAISGVGCGDLTTGYSDYASRGAYTVTSANPVLELSTIGTGTVTSDVGGLDCGASCSAGFAAGTMVTLVATPGTGQRLNRWSGPCEAVTTRESLNYQPACAVTMDQAESVTAVFGPATTLTLRAGGGVVQTEPSSGSVSAYTSGATLCGNYNGSTYPYCTISYASGAVAQIVAFDDIAQPTKVFKGWFGPCRVSDNGSAIGYVCTTAVRQAQTVTAVFGTSTSKVLGVSTSGSGSVTSNTGGIACGTSCYGTYEPGASVVLTATASGGQSFLGWSGACSGTSTTCTVTISAAASVGATFGASGTKVLTVSRTGAGTGTVTSGDGLIACGLVCQASYATSGTVTLSAQANPDDGSVFAGWSGGSCSGTSSCTVTMSAATSVSANFMIPPKASSFSPASGIVGSSVVITGTNLTGATGVTFNTTAATSYTVDSATQITATVPAGATSGTLTVTTPGGSGFTSSTFTVTVPPAPTITSFSPASGIVGSSVVITGTNFTGATGVTFNTTAATSYTVNSATQITATVPSGATTGKVKVTTSGGTATSAGTFTVGVAPTITSFSPASAAVGATVVITGTNFTGATGVTFNTTAASVFTVDSATQISAKVPTGATTGTIKVTASGLTATSPSSFTVVAAPTITSFTPATAAPGATVTITGTNFTGASAVAFNGTAAASYTVVSATSMTAVVPAGATTGKVAVTAAGVTVQSSGSLTVVAAPTITSFTPASAAVGGSVVITGSGFVAGATVKFNTTAATTVTVNSATQITATVPTGATTGKISVTAAGVTTQSSTNLTVVAAPTVTGFTPASAAVGGTVVITGTNLTGATAVKFNTTVATVFTVNSATQITATVPTGASTGKISVTAAGLTVASASSLTVVAAPTITSFTPATAAPGATVTITGTGFTGAAAVSFNGTAAASYTVVSATSVTAVVPAGATTGKLAVTAAGVTVQSSGSLTVVAAPTITSFTPASAAAATSVVITGTNFTGATAVKFNTVAATVFTVNSATQITATVPTGAVTGKVSVTVAGATVQSSTDFIGTSATITSFTPTSVKAGTAVTITGTNLSSVTAVRFGTTTSSVAASMFTIVSPTTIVVGVPVGTVTGGRILLTTPAVTVQSGSTYSSSGTVAPTITSFTATSGPVGTLVTVTGTNLGAATAVTLNGVAATYTVLSATQLRLTVPVGATSGKIAVTTAGGSGTSSGTFTVA